MSAAKIWGDWIPLVRGEGNKVLYRGINAGDEILITGKHRADYHEALGDEYLFESGLTIWTVVVASSAHLLGRKAGRGSGKLNVLDWHTVTAFRQRRPPTPQGKIMDPTKQAQIAGVHPYLQAQLTHAIDPVASTFKYRLGEEIRHIKGGGLYIVSGLPNEYVLEHSREPAYAYLMADGRTCVRSQKEMEDGRFVSVPEGTILKEINEPKTDLDDCVPGGCSEVEPAARTEDISAKAGPFPWPNPKATW